MITPIGGLIREGETKSAKNFKGGHTASAPCGCEVTVSRFTRNSTLNTIRRCDDHELDPNR